MITNKQLDFALSEIQEVQRKNIGGNVGITITTACGTHEFIVIVEYGYKQLSGGSCSMLEKTFEFLNTITEDQCVDYLQDIDKIIKEYIN